jgi:hypothetical protein
LSTTTAVGEGENEGGVLTGREGRGERERKKARGYRKK